MMSLPSCSNYWHPEITSSVFNCKNLTKKRDQYYLTVKNTDTPRPLSSDRNHCLCHLELEIIWKFSSKIMNKMIQMLQEKKWIGWINIKKKTKKNQSINISRLCSQDSLWIHIQIHSLCMELILEAKNWKLNI